MEVALVKNQKIVLDITLSNPIATSFWISSSETTGTWKYNTSKIRSVKHQVA